MSCYFCFFFSKELPSLAADSIKQELVTLPDAAELERCIR